jgi:hypothetical protein
MEDIVEYSARIAYYYIRYLKAFSKGDLDYNSYLSYIFLVISKAYGNKDI